MESSKFNINLLFLLCISVVQLNAQSDIYWVGGNGNWDDVSMWYKDAAGTQPAGIIPNSNFIVHFTDQSSTTPIWNVRFQPGSYEVHSIIVETEDDFRILMDGTDNNEVDVSVYGNLGFLPTHRLEYGSTSTFNNVWKFKGSGSHDVHTGGLDLFHIELHDENGSFHQLDDLMVSEKIRMFAGTWNSNNHDVTTNYLLFDDNEPSNSPLTKLFNAGSSEISCYDWESGLTYGSLVVTGNHTIRTSRFRGSPKQINGPPFSYNDIHLLEYPDLPSGGSPIEHNNFECRSCIINNITIEDTGNTQIADRVTVNGKLTVVNEGSSILFNGGNGRNSEITFNGIITSPKVINCDDTLTIFSSIYTDETIFIKPSGTLTIEDAVINNIQTETSGGATFNLSKCILQGASSGWNIITPPNSTSYYWVGPNTGTGDWNDPTNWVIEDGNSNGCLPKIIDDVFIDPNSKTNIRIPSQYKAVCRNFIWTNKKNLVLTLDGSPINSSTLNVSGHFDLDETATISAVNIHEIYFSSTTQNYIETRGVLLPKLRFIGTSGDWTLQDDLTCDQLTFISGTFNSNNHDVETDIWNAFEEYPKHFNFSSSHIKVNGIMDLAEFESSNVTVDPGSSLIECEKLNSVVTDLYNVRFINTNSLTLNNVPYVLNSLILKGTGQVTTASSLTLNNLIFKEEGSTLVLDDSEQLIINTGILSQTFTNNPGTLKSKTSGNQADIIKSIGNICVTGPVQFIDINASILGICNAPDGIDGGNNSNIDFSDGSGQSVNAYWIGGSGEWTVKSNWSGISGGCPANNDPNFYQNVIFDNNGIFTGGNTVSVTGFNACGNIFFHNMNPLTLNIASQLSPTNVTVDGGYAIIAGKNLIVDNTTSLTNSGFMISDMLTYLTETLHTESGIILVKQGSKFYVQP